MPEPTPELNKALAAFQAELPRIVKNEHADAGKFGYDYAGLDTVSLETLPGLGKHGLAFTAFPGTDSDGRPVLDYALLHESGEERTGQFPLWLLLPERVTAQQIGGYITYARRYCLCPATGVAPGGEDNDAAGSEEAPSNGGRWMNRRMDIPPAELQAKRTPTKTTGAELEQLRDGTVEPGAGDRPAARVKGAQGGADAWQDQPPGKFEPYEPEKTPGSIDGRQRSLIFARLTELTTDPPAQRRILSGILGHDVTSRKDIEHLPRLAAEKVLKDLETRAEAKKAAEEAAKTAEEQDAATEVPADA